MTHRVAIDILLWIALLAILTIVATASARSEPAHVEVARSFIGTTEHGGNNRGKEVKMFLASVGLDQGYAWCAAFVSYCLSEADVLYPTKRTAGARSFISKKSIKASDVLTGKVKVEPGWLVIWQKGNSWSGHIGIVTEWGKRHGKGIEGNTNCGKGSRSDGDGVCEKPESIQPGNYFRITHFEPVVPRPDPEPTKVYAPTIKDFGGPLPRERASGAEGVR